MKTIRISALIFALTLAPLTNSAQAVDTTKTEIEVASNLFEAIEKIDIVSLNVLLADGADVDTVDADGNTPLMLASKIGNPRIMEIILAHNPDVNAKNNRDETALMTASKYGLYDIAEQLINRGAKINETNADGLTPKQIAMRNGHRQVGNLLQSYEQLSMMR